MNQHYSALNTDKKFDIMADYQLAIETKSILIENSPTDKYKYSLYEVVEPYPSFDEYINGNGFIENNLLGHSCDIIVLCAMQNNRRILLPALI